MKIGGEVFDIGKGDVIPIPKGKYHHIFDVSEKVELVVATYPGFDKEDVLY